MGFGVRFNISFLDVWFRGIKKAGLTNRGRSHQHKSMAKLPGSQVGQLTQERGRDEGSWVRYRH